MEQGSNVCTQVIILRGFISMEADSQMHMKNLPLLPAAASSADVSLPYHENQNKHMTENKDNC